MNEAEERKAYDDWLHQSPEFADTIISAWDVWMGRAALAQPEPAAPTEPAPGWCKHCQQYTIDEPLQAEPTVGEPVAWINEHGHIDRGLDAILDPTGWTPLYTHPPRVVKPDVPAANFGNMEPVAGWLIYAAGDEANGAFWRTKPDDEQLETMASECGLPVIARSLHIAANPPRTALTDAELERMYNAHASYQECGPLISGWFDFARAIEAAHGIGGPRNE